MSKECIYYCSFCGKSQHETEKLIAGPVMTFICAECVMVCVDIIDDARRPARVMHWGDIGIHPVHASGWFR